METVENIAETRSKRSMFAWSAIWIGLIALLIMLAIGLRRTQQGPVVRGEKAPDFAFTSFDGKAWESRELAGKVIVLNIWASWCKPCEQEAADLQSAWEIYQDRDDIVFLGLDYVDTEPEAMAYLEKFQISYPNGPDLGQEIYEDFRASGVPETYIIDQTGTLAYVKIGPFNNLSEILSAIDPLLQD
jgi:cytochrome c biogenesis protein CcmG/thiol:disulfide interchange protein DsbE